MELCHLVGLSPCRLIRLADFIPKDPFSYFVPYRELQNRICQALENTAGNPLIVSQRSNLVRVRVSVQHLGRNVTFALTPVLSPDGFLVLSVLLCRISVDVRGAG